LYRKFLFGHGFTLSLTFILSPQRGRGQGEGAISEFA
jgi:hypothetical protein